MMSAGLTLVSMVVCLLVVSCEAQTPVPFAFASYFQSHMVHSLACHCSVLFACLRSTSSSSSFCFSVAHVLIFCVKLIRHPKVLQRAPAAAVVWGNATAGSSKRSARREQTERKWEGRRVGRGGEEKRGAAFKSKRSRCYYVLQWPDLRGPDLRKPSSGLVLLLPLAFSFPYVCFCLECM